MIRSMRLKVIPVAIAFAVLVCLFGSPTRTLRAAVPGGPAVFTVPLVFDNEFFPFVVGATKVFRGKDEGERIVFTDQYLSDTRDFVVGGNTVSTRILREVEFHQGELSEISLNYFAQADDGSVYYFGELVDIYEDGVVVGHDGTWLVGGPTLPGDPVDAGNAAAPALFMPANPELGDTFKPEDLFPLVDETVLVEKFVKKLKVEAGTYKNVMQVKETSQLGPGFERKWYAKGVGVVRTKGGGEVLNLIASSLLPTAP